MPLVWLARRQTTHPVERVYGPDLMLELCRVSPPLGLRHFFLGGEPGTPERLAEVLQERFPGLVVAGTSSPPFRLLTAGEQAILIEEINTARPDIVWVSLGSPKQDIWMAANRSRIEAPALIGVGAAFGFHTGQIRQAPPWMRRNGLEWLFRLWQEPRRLWRRYLVSNTIFLFRLAEQAFGRRRYPPQ
jgi:N-acetylglucosaminyldiphosphoundecaprenol N-acetyl-beta-D-mannosaminyltransferase